MPIFKDILACNSKSKTEDNNSTYILTIQHLKFCEEEIMLCKISTAIYKIINAGRCLSLET